MASETSRRMLLNPAEAVTGGASDPKSAAVPCGQVQAYRDCLPEGNNQNGKPKEPCDRYKRTCT